MNILLENFLLYLSFIFLVISIIRIKKKFTKWLISCSALLLLFLLLLLLYFFLVSDFSIAYVYSFSSTDLSLFYKISAVLAGESGTLLFWAFMINLQAFWFAHKRTGKNEAYEILRIVLVICAVFVLFTALNSPFIPFSSLYAMEIKEMGLSPDYVPPEGSGLNLVLQDPWMAVHPPLTFIGYSLLTIPFAAALVYLWKGRLLIQDIWARLAWFFLTPAIATGSYWTYKIFARAEYWVWDPVETSSLIPWLTLTAYLHLAKNQKEFRLFPSSLLIFSFILTIYATFVTRSGIWPSIHAFAGTSANLAILIFLILITIISSTLILVRLRDPRDYTGSGVFSSSSMNYNTGFFLSILAFICFFGITFPAILHALTGNQAIMGPGFFNFWTFPFILVLIFLCAVCLISGIFPENILKKYIYSVSITGILLAIVSLRFPLIRESADTGIFGRILVHLYLPVLVFSLLVIIYVLYRDILINGRDPVRRTGSYMIHLGLVLIVFGVIMSTSYDSQYQAIFSVTETGQTKEVGDGYAIRLNDLLTGPQDDKWAQTADISILKDGRTVSSGNSSYVSTPTGGGNVYAMIHHGIFSEYYVVFHSPYAEPDPDYFTFPVTLRILPFLNFVWTGIILFFTGMGARLV